PRLPPRPTLFPYTTLFRSLDLIVELPWQKATEDHLDLTNAHKVLDEDHYSLEEVKERILEHLAVLKLNPNAKAPILCFVGPPGTDRKSTRLNSSHVKTSYA